MKIRLFLISLFLLTSNTSYANQCVTRIKTQCEIDAKQVWIDSGHLYSCQWIPDTGYPYYGICILFKVNP